MTRFQASSLAGFLLLTAAAGPGHAQVRDSAGIRIVENPESVPQPAGRWVLDAEPTLSIGAVEGTEAELFDGVFHGRVLSDGRIAIANENPVQVRVFDAAGGHLTSFGRKGEGPGEFAQRISRISVRGLDTLALENGRLDVHLYSAAGTRIRSQPGPLRAGLFASITEWLGGDRFLLLNTLRDATPSPTEGVFANPVMYTIWSATTQRVDTLGRYQSLEQFRAAPGIPPLIIPFGRRAYSAVGPQHIFVADNAAYSIRAFTREGWLVHVIRKHYSPLPVSGADREAAIHRTRQGALFTDPRLGQLQAAMNQQLEQLPFPDTHPPFDAMIADRTGCLWVRAASHAPGTNSRWDVFDPVGVLTASVTMPKFDRVLDISRDYVLAVIRDDLDVEYVRLYRLHR